MSKHQPAELRSLREASQWLARLRAEPQSEEAVTSWLRWCEGDAGNAVAFERVQTLWRQMNPLAAQLRGADLGMSAPLKIVQRLRVGAMRVGAMSFMLGSNARRMAALAACALAGVVFWHWSQYAAVPTRAIRVREVRVTALPDGSAVDLAARTSLAVDFAGTERRLQMDSGEAFFKVRPDKHRPFVVRAGRLSVTAVGTAFDVKADDGNVTVTVQEGVVSVAPQSGAEGSAADGSWRVGAGDQLQYSEINGSTRLSSVDMSTVLAWREGRLEYVNTPLVQVLADVNRYSQTPVRAADPGIGALTFTGTVFTDSIDSWLDGLPGALPVRLERSSAVTMLIRK